MTHRKSVVRHERKLARRGALTLERVKPEETAPRSRECSINTSRAGSRLATTARFSTKIAVNFTKD